MHIDVSYQFLPKTPSAHASLIMDHFGIGFETGLHPIAAGLELPVQPGEVILFTGASGSGKSSLMRAVAAQLEQVVNIDTLELPDAILVDALGMPFQESLAMLSACGLGEAQLLLRTPRELSDGQRYRFRLALGLSRQPAWLLADEFTATLDRTLAKVIAFNLRRQNQRTGVGLLLATTHEDIAADLNPTLHMHCRLDGRIEWTRHDTGDAKKNGSACGKTSGSAPAPKPTGRTSLGGITAATTSASPA